MQGLLDGAAAAESDVVLQIKRDTAEYLGHGDAATGLEIMHARAGVEARRWRWASSSTSTTSGPGTTN